MPKLHPTSRSTPATSEQKLSDVAKHLVLPSGIVSTGYPAVAAQCRKMGVVHDEWQQGLARAILAKRADGLYAASVGGILISICRQVGKTFTIGTIVFALCILFPRLKVIWTAHHSATSDETFDALAGLANRRQIKPYVRHVRKGNGKQRIIFTNGSQIMFGAREHGFGRGITGVSIIVCDEAQILKARALSDMVPTTNTIRNPLIIYMGTPPKPTDPAEVFKSRRRKALAVKKLREQGQDVTFDTLYVEVGADRRDDPEAISTLEKANPSFPSRTPWESIQRLRENLTDPDDWRREGLGVWDDDQEGSRHITEPEWQATSVSSVPQSGLRALGVAFSLDGKRVALAGALKYGEPDAHVELIDSFDGSLEDGIAPLADWIAARWESIATVSISGKAGSETLALALRERGVPASVVHVLTAPEYFAACALLPSAIRAREVTHPVAPDDDTLDASIAISDKKNRGTSGSWAWAATTATGDETPTEAVSIALWGVRTTKRRPGRKQVIV